MNKDVKPKQWYQLPSGVEYSKDFKFFSEHQIRIVRSRNKYIFCSKIEPKSFKTCRAVFGNYEFSESQLDTICKEIHKEILNGKHGQGALVD